ncbi:MAG: hypothetical protein KJO13_08920 [Gammaproteobacteria bacterium]|nr:hypothetical protein [Gammaproteobacteria bacterium]
MRWFELLKRGIGFSKKSATRSPIKTVRDPAEVRQERLARRAQRAEELPPAPAPPPPPPGARKVVAAVNPNKKELDLFDTGSLEIAPEGGDSDNPYDTQTWQINTQRGPRRVDDLSAVNKDRKSGEPDNPYDTIVTKKGW